MRVVLDHEQDRVAGLDFEPIVGNLLDRPLRHDMDAGRVHHHLHRGGGRRLGRRARADVFQRQIEREGAAHVRRTAQLDFAAEKVRQLAADGKPQPGAAVFAAGAGVGLHERLENDLLVLLRNADAGVGDFEGHHRRRLLEHRVPGAPAALDLRNA